jgi:hypothetical protein
MAVKAADQRLERGNRIVELVTPSEKNRRGIDAVCLVLIAPQQARLKRVPVPASAQTVAILALDWFKRGESRV